MFEPGTVIADRFLLGPPIGEGGAARVFRAQDLLDEQEVALKVITEGSARNRAHLGERLQREAEVMRAVAHPNVLPVYEVGAHEGFPYLATQLAVSSVMRHVEEHAVHPSQVVAWMIQVCSALAVAHQRGVIHRDVKPQNLLLDAEGTVLLADFGIALIHDRTRLTTTGTAMGSVAFMPPEQRLDAAGVDARADIYAVGATLYQLITGRNPADLFLCGPDSPRLEGLPHMVRTAILRSTHYLPDKRYRSARRLAAALMAAHAEVQDMQPVRHHEHAGDPTTIDPAALATSLTWLGDAFGAVPTLMIPPPMAPPPAPDAQPIAQPPSDEAARIRALQATSLLDSAREERFDRYTRLARQLLRVPMAVVSLVDTDRQWFKSIEGLEAVQTPRDVAFCAHAIRSPGAMTVIEDATQDPRFRDNPLVTGGHAVRFYAGMPIAGADGQPLGTLCILDRRPRTLHDEERAMLRKVARMVEKELARTPPRSLDRITGLSNHRGFVEQAARALAFDRQQHQGLLLVQLELEHTAGGHGSLRRIADDLKNVFDEAVVLGRIGPTAFGLLVPRGTDVGARVARVRSRVAARTGVQLPVRFAVVALDDAGECLASRMARVDAIVNAHLEAAPTQSDFNAVSEWAEEPGDHDRGSA